MIHFTHKASLLQLLFLCFSCSQAQTGQTQWSEKTRYWIPDADMMVVFPDPPEFFEERVDTQGFSEAQHYRCLRSYQSDSTYFWNVGVYRRDNENIAPTVLLSQGLTMNRLMINDFGAKILLDETLVHQGLPAHRIKAFFSGNAAQGLKPFYIQMLCFSREENFVTMTTFNATEQGKEWREEAFFKGIKLLETCPKQKTVTSIGNRSTTGTFGNLLCLPSQGLALRFSKGAPLVKKVETPQYWQTKYHLAASSDTLPLMHGIEFFKGKNGPLQYTESFFSTVMSLLLGIAEQKEASKQDRVVSKQTVRFKGKDALEVVMERDLRPGMPGYPGHLLYHTLSFIHQGDLVMLFTYRESKETEATTRQFFDSVEWLN